jgi:phosphoketolase
MKLLNGMREYLECPHFLLPISCYTPSTPQKAKEQLLSMFSSVNGLNVMAVSKHALPLTLQSAPHDHGSWSVLSADMPNAHDIAIVGVGDCMVEESLHAKKLIQERNDVSVQVVAVDEMTMLDRPSHPERVAFEQSLDQSLARVWTYIGHPKAIKSYLWEAGASSQISAVLGYRDKGDTEAGLDRFAENGVSRYDIAHEALTKLGSASGRKLEAVEKYQHKRRII